MQQQQLHSWRKCRNGFPIPLSALEFVLMLFALFLHPASSCIEQKSSLLQFLARLSQYGGLTLSWQNSTDCCTWEGVACGADGAGEGAGLAGRRDKQRVLELTGETTEDGCRQGQCSHNSPCSGSQQTQRGFCAATNWAAFLDSIVFLIYRCDH
jgi:hypothetical protein